MKNKARLTLSVILLLICLAAVPVLVQAAAPERIVSLVPSLTENLFALGVGDKVVGVTSWGSYPPVAQERTVGGDACNLNVEVL